MAEDTIGYLLSRSAVYCQGIVTLIARDFADYIPDAVTGLPFGTNE